MTQPVQDTIDFALQAEKTVVNTTVKITAYLSGTVLPDMTEETVRDNIRTVTKNFIETANWQFSNTTRSKNDSDLEVFSVTATTRVSESENYNLTDRANAASIKGLKIYNHDIDTTPPASMIEAAESELRVSLLEKATKELEIINTALGDTYRLGAVNFQANAAMNSNNMYANSAPRAIMASMAAPKGGSGYSDDEDTLGNAVKLTMRASISFRKSAA